MTKNNVKDNKEKISELKSIIDGLGDLKSLAVDVPNTSGTFDTN